MNALFEFCSGFPRWVYVIAGFPLPAVVLVTMIWIAEILQWLRVIGPRGQKTYPGQATLMLVMMCVLWLPFSAVVLIIAHAALK